ncbi:MAG: hypothetical protein HY909_28745, partial [Deltaproteobacteria bacterium]|nr:hypothetical protein [Deltaproteobacteria bacterium]
MGSLRRAVLAFLGAACSGVEPPSAPAAPPRWPCPPEWVAHAQGGCGPAVVLCPGDGGAAPGACEGIDYTHPHPVGDGGTSFYRLPDGAVGGGWPEALPELAEVETGSLAPPEDFAPTAGIPSCPAPWRRLGDG